MCESSSTVTSRARPVLAAERSAGGGENERSDRRRGTPSRHWNRASARCRPIGAARRLVDGRRRRAPRGDEALLVREGERDATLEGPERCLDAGEAEIAFEHAFGSLASRTRRPSRPPGCARRQRGGKRAERLPSRHERAEQRSGFASHLDRLCADRAGGPEESTRLIDPRCLTARGQVSARDDVERCRASHRSESTRSRMPAMTGEHMSESFTPRPV